MQINHCIDDDCDGRVFYFQRYGKNGIWICYKCGTVLSTYQDQMGEHVLKIYDAIIKDERGKKK